MNQFLLFYLYGLLSSLFLVQVPTSVDRSFVEQKKWWEYSEQEKDSLRQRWEGRVDEVVQALKERNPPPGVDWSPAAETGPLAGLPRYDLRGINLAGYTLGSVDLYFANLQGARLDEASLRGAHLDEANLQGAYLRGADLQGAYMDRADLHGADLSFANLNGAYFFSANLQRADLTGADLQGARLKGADLQGAHLEGADLKRAYLIGADLKRAYLRGADLQGADMLGVRFDTTYLSFVNFEETKNNRFIVWGDRLTKRYFIGEEEILERPLDSRILPLPQIAEDIYRNLKSFYRKAGIVEISREFHYRENEVRTKRYSWYHPRRIFRLLLLKWTYGYGARKMWLLWYSLIVIGVFTLVFASLTLSRKTKSGIYLIRSGGDKEEGVLLPFRKGLLFLDCFYFSLVSFATFGYGALRPKQWLELFLLEPAVYKPVRWARIFVGLEAAIGIYVFALLVTVLFGG